MGYIWCEDTLEQRQVSPYAKVNSELYIDIVPLSEQEKYLGDFLEVRNSEIKEKNRLSEENEKKFEKENGIFSIRGFQLSDSSEE